GQYPAIDHQYPVSGTGALMLISLLCLCARRGGFERSISRRMMSSSCPPGGHAFRRCVEKLVIGKVMVPHGGMLADGLTQPLQIVQAAGSSALGGFFEEAAEFVAHAANPRVRQVWILHYCRDFPKAFHAAAPHAPVGAPEGPGQSY